MTNIASSRVLYQTLKEVNADLDQMLREASQQIAGILAQNAVNGVIPTSRRDLVLDQAGAVISNFFARGRSVYATDGVTPLTRYATILNYRLALVIARTIAAHTLYLRRRLPEDLTRWLATARPITQEQVNVTNPLAGYDAPHTWVDPNGYRLSDRIWWRGQNIRLKIDALLTDGIRSGRSALQMSKDLESFLMPTRRLRRTNKPYGTDASYHAMVLARSEISRAASEATFAASRANPFVSGMDWRLSARHPKVDICDQLATIGMSGERIKDPYPLESAPMVVASSHPACLCANLPAVTESADDVIASLRAELQAAKPAPLTPVSATPFMRTLVGDYLTSLVSRELLAILGGTV